MHSHCVRYHDDVIRDVDVIVILLTNKFECAIESYMCMTENLAVKQELPCCRLEGTTQRMVRAGMGNDNSSVHVLLSGEGELHRSCS